MVVVARALGAALLGVEARLIDVQISLPGWGPEGAFRIVGMGDGALREGRERIRGAFLHAGYAWPPGVVTVNLAPASTRKEGPALDLPIALALLRAHAGFLPGSVLERTLVLGELTLDGRVRPVRGTLACVEAARRAGVAEALVPSRNVREAAAVPGVVVRGVECLLDAVAHLSGALRLPAAPPTAWAPEAPEGAVLAEVRGQPAAVRAATLAAVGGHNLLLTGPPGAGKTLLARALRALLPPLSREEAIEVSRIQSASGLLEEGLVSARPFRAPHHTASLAGLVGGGAVPRPGEVSLAHLGVLFLDELAEFPRPVLEGLRQPVEDGEVVIGRAAGRARFPCQVVLVAAMNPCPCGWAGSGVRPCRCPGPLAARYRARISGPLLDRFDLRVTVKPVDPSALLAAPTPDLVAGSAALAEARGRQAARAAQWGFPRPWNARIPPGLVRTATAPTEEAIDHLASLARRLGLTGRGIHRTLRVARTAADLAGRERVEVAHVGEALQYRGDEEPGAVPPARLVRRVRGRRARPARRASARARPAGHAPSGLGGTTRTPCYVAPPPTPRTIP